MEKFNILIEEILSTTIEVEATSSEEAVEKIQEMYKNQEIVLTGDDCAGVLIQDMDME